MMQPKKSGKLDIILNVLELCVAASPDSTFLRSLLQQYRERGSLSKKQLEGLHSKAGKIPTIPPGKLATIQAIILKKPTRYKSEVTIQSSPVSDTPDRLSTKLIAEILDKYPGHKRVLYFQMKLSRNEALLPAELQELERFYKLLI